MSGNNPLLERPNAISDQNGKVQTLNSGAAVHLRLPTEDSSLTYSTDATSEVSARESWASRVSSPVQSMRPDPATLQMSLEGLDKEFYSLSLDEQHRRPEDISPLDRIEDLRTWLDVNLVSREPVYSTADGKYMVLPWNNVDIDLQDQPQSQAQRSCTDTDPSAQDGSVKSRPKKRKPRPPNEKRKEKDRERMRMRIEKHIADAALSAAEEDETVVANSSVSKDFPRLCNSPPTEQQAQNYLGRPRSWRMEASPASTVDAPTRQDIANTGEEDIVKLAMATEIEDVKEAAEDKVRPDPPLGIGLLQRSETWNNNPASFRRGKAALQDTIFAGCDWYFQTINDRQYLMIQKRNTEPQDPLTRMHRYMSRIPENTATGEDTTLLQNS